MKHEIKNRFTGGVLFSCEVPEGMESGMIARHAVETAIARDVNLQGVNLQGANLQGANLLGANLQGVNLQGVNLQGVNLLGANLQGVNLQGANLLGANLQGANLLGANLRDAKNAPLIITGLRWVVYISGTGNMRIGCQNHSIKHWDNFSDELINRMDDCALEFWKQHKEMLMGICNSYKHKNEKST